MHRKHYRLLLGYHSQGMYHLCLFLSSLCYRSTYVLILVERLGVEPSVPDPDRSILCIAFLRELQKKLFRRVTITLSLKIRGN